MSSLSRFAIAATAVLVVAVAAVTIGPRGNPGSAGAASGPPASAPTPTAIGSPASAATAAVSPGSSPPTYIWPARLAAGTYTTRLSWDVPFTVTFSVPDGWDSRDVEVVRDPTLSVTFQLVDDLYADPCRHLPRETKLGPSVDDLASGLAALPGLDATAPVPVALAGYSGKYLEYSVRNDIGCEPADFYLWTNPEGSILPVNPLGPPIWAAVLANARVWILDVDGVRYVISSQWSDAATPADLAELQGVVDSIRIQPLAPAASPTPDTGCTIVLSDPAAGRDLAAPYTTTLGAATFDKLGPAPSPFPLSGLTAQINFRGAGSGWRPASATSFRPLVRLLGPDGTDRGFATITMVNGFQGSFVFDRPGTWRASIEGVADACPHVFPVEVSAAAPPG